MKKIATFGDDWLQRLKIKNFFDNSVLCPVYTTSQSKRDIVLPYALRYKDEKIYFIDDKIHHQEEVKNIPNVHFIQYVSDIDLFKVCV